MTPAARLALARLREGNARFVSGIPSLDGRSNHADRVAVSSAQNPFAIVLGCSDSRVPAEIVFDQGLGDLFVIRVAGNIVAPSQVGSVEFAVERFGTSLVVVLGHTQCGAVLATLEQVRSETSHSANVRSIVDRIRPSVVTVLASRARTSEGVTSEDDLLRQAVRANVRASVDHLRHGSASLEQLIQDRRLAVVGAEYSLETGKVDFFDGAVEDEGS